MMKVILAFALAAAFSAAVPALALENYEAVLAACGPRNAPEAMRKEYNRLEDSQLKRILQNCRAPATGKVLDKAPPVVQAPPPRRIVVAPPPPAPVVAAPPPRVECSIRIGIEQAYHPVHKFQITAKGLGGRDLVVNRKVGGNGTYDVPVPCEFAQAAAVEVCLGPPGPMRGFRHGEGLALARANIARGVGVFNPDRPLRFVGGPPRGGQPILGAHPMPRTVAIVSPRPNVYMAPRPQYVPPISYYRQPYTVGRPYAIIGPGPGPWR